MGYILRTVWLSVSAPWEVQRERHIFSHLSLFAWVLMFISCCICSLLSPFGLVSRLFKRRARRNLLRFYSSLSSDKQSPETEGSLLTHSPVQHITTSTSQDSSFHEKAAHCTDDAIPKVSSGVSIDTAPQDLLAVNDEGQQEGNRNSQAPLDLIQKAQADHIQKVETDFRKLYALLGTFYLEMELTKVEAGSPEGSSEPRRSSLHEDTHIPSQHNGNLV